MTLTKQIEWLQQKANIAGELAQDYLSDHDTAGYARYSDAADKYQSVVDSLTVLKDLTQSVIDLADDWREDNGTI